MRSDATHRATDALARTYGSFVRDPMHWTKRLLRRITWTLFTVFDVRLVRRDGGELGSALRDAKRLLAPNPPDVLFDVGARNGSTVLELKRQVGDVTIHCFEASAEAFQVLSDRLRHLPNVHCHRYAVCDRSGMVTFHLNRTDSTNSLLPTSSGAHAWVDERHLETVKTEEVPAISIDDFCAQERIGRIGLLKLDIQGAELLALAGARRLLGAGSIDLILSEIAFVPIYEGQPLFTDVVRELGAYGYQLFGLYELHSGRNRMLAWADALFMSPALARTIRLDEDRYASAV